MGQLALRRPARNLVPIEALMVALAGCGSAAPSAAPIANAGGATAAPATDRGQTDPATDTAPSIPTVQPTPEKSTPTPTRTPGQCFDSLSSSASKAGPKTTIKAYGSKQVHSTGGSKTAITVGTGKAVEADDAFGGADEGDQMLVFPVTGTLESGSFGLLSYTQFTLWDPKGNACKTDLFSSAVDSAQRLSLESLSSDGRSVTGKIAFEVPKGKDYAMFTLVWARVSTDEIGPIGWKG